MISMNIYDICHFLDKKKNQPRPRPKTHIELVCVGKKIIAKISRIKVELSRYNIKLL